MISVIIPNYNNAKFLKTCLTSLLKSQIDMQIIVVDDASTDQSVDIIKKFPITLIKNKQNLGPTKSRNIGAKKANGKYLLFLDGDAVLDSNYVSLLVKFLDQNPKVGVISGKVISEHGHRMFYNFGYDPSPIKDGVANIIDTILLRLKLKKGIIKFINPIINKFTLNFVKDKILAVDWVVEMAFMIRQDLFEQIKGFDEQFVVFFEGPDLCRRVRQVGYQVVFNPNTSVHHLGGHSLDL